MRREGKGAMIIKNRLTGEIIKEIENLSGANLSGADLRDADLSGADLRDADLSGANLSGADLSGADLRGADLRGAYLRGANLNGADLRDADLSGAYLSGADLSGADLRGANLSGAALSGADLRGAYLSGANLSGADLSGAYLRGANLSGANLSDAKGLLNSADWLGEHFCSDGDGLIVFKAIGNTDYDAPTYWRIEPGAVLEEIVNPDRYTPCACGVSFGTLDFIRANYARSDHWHCRIRWLDLADVIVPYNTDGKARCARLEVIEKLPRE